MAQPAAGAAPRAGSITVRNTLESSRTQRSPSDVHSKRSLGMDVYITLITTLVSLRNPHLRGGLAREAIALHTSLPRSSLGLRSQIGWDSPPCQHHFFMPYGKHVMAWKRGRNGRDLSLPGAEEPEQAEAGGAEAGAEAAPSSATALDADLPAAGKCSLLSNGSPERSLEAPGNAWRASYPKPCSGALQDTSFQAGSPHGSHGSAAITSGFC